MKFAFIDIFLFAALGFFIYRGYKGGVTKRLFNLLALIGSIVLATKLMHPVGKFLIDLLLISPLWGYIWGFALVVIVVMVATIFVYRRFEKNAIATKSSQFFGVLFGIFEGLIVIGLVLLMLKLFDTPEKETRNDSLLYKPMVNFVPGLFDMLKSYLPGASAFRTELSETFEKFDIFDEAPETGKKL